MTNITFYGGVKDIGGNKFLVDDNGTKVFMDFGMSFTEEGKFFAEFLNARTSNSLIDMFELGILPKIKGLYRKDYANLKARIDTCAHQVRRCGNLLHSRGI